MYQRRQLQTWIGWILVVFNLAACGSPTEPASPPTETVVQPPISQPSAMATEKPTTYQTYEIGEEIWGLAIADLNGDSYPDIAAADAGSGVIRLLFNTGNGNFDEAGEIATGKNAYGVFAADLDGDSHIDLAVGHDHQDDQMGKLSVLLNNGDGTFKTQADYSTGYDSWWVSAADLDGDTDLDLFIEVATKPPPVGDDGQVGVGVWLNNGDGSFQDSRYYYLEAQRLGSVTAADLSDDTYLDLAVSHYPMPIVSVLLNNGDGSFGEAVDYDVGWGPHGVTIANLNEDRYPDLVVPSTRGVVSLLFNNGDGSFQEKMDIETGGDPHDTAAIDLDGDSLLDLLVAPTGSGTASVFSNRGDGTFELTKDYYYSGVWVSGFRVVDVDGDGNRDLVASGGEGSVYVFPIEDVD